MATSRRVANTSALVYKEFIVVKLNYLNDTVSLLGDLLKLPLTLEIIYFRMLLWSAKQSYLLLINRFTIDKLAS